MANLTAIILALDEERNIGQAIGSLYGFASRVIVVDSGSCDRTVDIARSMGAEVLCHDFVSYADQFNWALDNAEIDTEWVLRIDADERMTPDVIAQSRRIMEKNDPEVTGILMQATFYMMGRPLRHGMTQKRKIMIFRRGVGRIEARRMDEHTVLSSGHAEEISARFDHYDFQSIDRYVRKLNWYASRELLDIEEGSFHGCTEGVSDKKLEKTRKLKNGFYYKFPLFHRAFLLFLYGYIFKLGFLDGKEGLIYNFLYCYMYRFVVDAKLYEKKKTGRMDRNPGALH